MSRIVLAGRELRVRRARLEVYNTGTDEADWNLELFLDDPAIPHVMFSGLVPWPSLPGPSVLDLAHVDDPIYLEHEGRRITICAGEQSSQLCVSGEPGRVRVHGSIVLSYYDLDDPEPYPPPREYPVEVDTEVELDHRA